LAYVIYCLEHNINIQRCSKYFIYTRDGIEHKYYPDFIVNNEIIEIKGYENENWKFKLAIVKSEHIKVLYKKDMKDILNYCYEKYGKDLT